MRATSAVDDLTITAEGYELLHSELETLRTDGRREMSERLRETRAGAPPDDNPALFEAFQEQAQLERRIAVLEGHLLGARIAEPDANGTAGIGSLLRLRDLETDELVEYTLVGVVEADPGQRRVSVDAPVGRALLAATPGDVVNVECPNATLRFEVLSVETFSRQEARQRDSSSLSTFNLRNARRRRAVVSERSQEAFTPPRSKVTRAGASAELGHRFPIGLGRRLSSRSLGENAGFARWRGGHSSDGFASPGVMSPLPTGGVGGKGHLFDGRGGNGERSRFPAERDGRCFKVRERDRTRC